MKKIPLIITLVLLLALWYLPTGAVAEDSYVTFKGGWSAPLDDSGDSDNGAAWEIAAGHNFTPNFGVEFGIGRFENEGSDSGATPPGREWNSTRKITVTPVTVTARGILPLEKLSLYAGAGIGLYFWEGETDCTYQGGSLSIKGDDRVSGVHIVAGLEYNFTPEVFAGVEAKWVVTENIEYSGANDEVAGKTSGHINGKIYAAKVGFRF